MLPLLRMILTLDNTPFLFKVFALDLLACLSSRSAHRAQRTHWRGCSTLLTFTACALQGPRRPALWSGRFPAPQRPRLPRSPLAARGSSPARLPLTPAPLSAKATGETRYTRSIRPSAWLLPRRRLAATCWFWGMDPTLVLSRTDEGAQSPSEQRRSLTADCNASHIAQVAAVSHQALVLDTLCQRRGSWCMLECSVP